MILYFIFDIIHERGSYMNRFKTAGFSISNPDFVTFCQFDEISDDEINDMYILKIGDFSLEIIQNKERIEEIFEDYGYEFGISVTTNKNVANCYYLGFYDLETVRDFMKAFHKVLQNHLEQPLRITD